MRAKRVTYLQVIEIKLTLGNYDICNFCMNTSIVKNMKWHINGSRCFVATYLKLDLGAIDRCFVTNGKQGKTMA
jgi:hypothetical protein